MANDMFRALAHPLRREIVERIGGGEATVGEVARDFAVSKPTISRHLKLLQEAGIVSRVVDGRTHRLALEPEALPRPRTGSSASVSAGSASFTSSASTLTSGRCDVTEQSGHVVRIERTFEASAEEVFGAWTSPEVIRRWFHVAPDWDTPEADVVRVAEVEAEEVRGVDTRVQAGDHEQPERREDDRALASSRGGKRAVALERGIDAGRVGLAGDGDLKPARPAHAAGSECGRGRGESLLAHAVASGFA
jgi:DNA-binding transcriptional ArsR family regulator